LLVIAVVVSAGAYSLRKWSIFNCSAAGYGPDSYLGYCQATNYGDYDHGAFWFGLEPAANAAAENAHVLFIGNSRVQLAFSNKATAEWFSSLGDSYYLLGFIGENYTFEAPLLRKLRPRAKVYVINVDSFFQRSETPPGKTVMRDDSSRARYEEKQQWLNVHSLYVIHESVLDAPRLGSYNLHPGPLPRYAGLNSVCWAIYRGEEAHGVTLHKMQAEIDTGPIAFQELFDIADTDTGLSLTLKCVTIGIPMVNKLLYAAQEPTGIPLRPQDLALRLYFGREAPRKGILCWGSPAKQVQNSVRACTFSPYRSPWGYPRTAVSGREIQIAKVQRTNRTSSAPPGRVGEVKKSGVEVSCCDEWIIVEKVFRNGELIPAKDVLHRGDDLRTPIE
jgi:UDP-4-amino-4-deoxy-L-arabinose formyltransferase/UDP-glucuronic acid dehydrogenase (UDP-4-keto-hexauronic acid decarboxylating)